MEFARLNCSGYSPLSLHPQNQTSWVALPGDRFQTLRGSQGYSQGAGLYSRPHGAHSLFQQFVVSKKVQQTFTTQPETRNFDAVSYFAFHSPISQGRKRRIASWLSMVAPLSHGASSFTCTRHRGDLNVGGDGIHSFLEAGTQSHESVFKDRNL